ncbi:MAG TPA: tetraacyldisaccharide 4'-kinase [Gammaproteobacteria bacterium]|nr:tetraacyldisaccharide 4'-kinase [Gammaproteobacteria bacterium]
MSRLQAQWYGGGWLSRSLAPLGWAYGGVMRLRRGLYRRGWLRAEAVPVPVVVVGNLTVGGSGKTPLVIALAERLRALGRSPAVVSRGYGRRGKGLRVVSDGGGRRLAAAECGDEPALIADRLALPVVVAADRAAAVRKAAELGADCVVADDGFQRLSLPRERAFVVVDGGRGFGNGRCLPAGPLREPVSALADADAVVLHGEGAVPGREPDLRMHLVPEGLRGIRSRRQSRELDWLQGRRVHAVAGIGDPDRFFALLRRLGARLEPHPFPDHHAYVPEEVRFPAGGTLVTTEKDAVKLAELGIDGWALRVSARLDPDPEPWLADLPAAQGGGVS